MNIDAHSFIASALLCFTAAGVAAQSLENQKQPTKQQIVYLSPSVFELPANLVRDLTRRGCQIPQQARTAARSNVIRGTFATPEQTDWAVLCSIKGVSSILVYWNGMEQKAAVLAPLEDRIFVQRDVDGQLRFLRSISPVDQEFILTHYRAHGGPKPPPINHQGIDDAFLERASTVWYIFRGKWIQLAGAD
jgi:hypothetical protein